MPDSQTVHSSATQSSALRISALANARIRWPEPCRCAAAGVWATVQFKFLQLEYPPVALAFERLLLSATLPVGAAVQTWGIMSAVGASAAAYYLAVLLALMYYALVLPLPSSFYKTQAGHAIGEASGM